MEPRSDRRFDPFSPDATTYDDPDFDIDSIDWNDPSACLKATGAGRPGDLSLPDIKSPEEYRREATATTEAHDHTECLAEYAIRPSPHLDAFRRVSESDRDRGTKYRDCFMWSYINQEDLLNTKALPLLLNARGRHPPSQFAATDMGAVRLGMVTKAIMPISLNGHVMILNGRRRILANMPEPQLKPEPRIAFQRNSICGGLSRCSPQGHPPRKIICGPYARIPDYFARTVKEAKEHRQEMLKDLDGKDRPVISEGREGILWARILRGIVLDEYLQLEVFSDLSSLAKKLVPLQKQYADDISPSKDLPEEYLEALLRFRHYLAQGAKRPLSLLQTSTVLSPTLRGHFAR
ncbi:hypothetical protein BBP40_012448 [Aspergillus hancockii]|nr:hypothetical protein BBP40_012448 [Aspergillus hancockii]